MDNTPTTTECKRIPLHARLYWYKLTANELIVLKAYVEHNWDGSVMWPSLARISAYTKLQRKTIQRVIQGWNERRKHKNSGQWVTVAHHPGLLQRGILTEIAPAKTSKQRPATYRLNESALTVDPKMIPFIREEDQAALPGIELSAVPGKPIRPRQKKLPGMDGNPKPRQKKLPGISTTYGHSVHSGQPATTDTNALVTPPDLRTVCPEATDCVSTDSLTESLLTKPLTHHAENGALNLPAWIAIKDMLQAELPAEEYELVVRPMRLLRVMAGNTLQIAIPPSAKIEAAAVARYGLLRECANRAGFAAVLTKYPDEWQLARLQEQFPDHTPIDWKARA